MAQWSMTSLGDVCEIQRGGSPRPIDQYITDAENGVNWIKIGDVAEGAKYIWTTKERIRPEGAKRSREVCSGDFLLTNSMSFGRPYILRTSGCIHDGWLVLRYDKESLDEDFLYHVLSSAAVYAQFTKFAAGAVVKNLNSDVVKRVAIPLPPLSEQRRIAAILDQADALRAKRREAMAQLDSLTQSIFIDMFAGADSSRWPTTTVADVAQPNGGMRTGPFGSQLLHGEFVEDGVAVLGIDNAVANEFRWGERRFITEAKYRTLKRYKVHPGDVLITIMGTCGRCAVVPDSIPLAINTKHLCCITLDQTKCLPEFLHAYFLRHPAARRYLEQTAKGAIMSGLNMGIIKDMPLPLAPMSLQKDFVKLRASIEAVKAAHGTSMKHLDALFASLQHRAFQAELIREESET